VKNNLPTLPKAYSKEFWVMFVVSLFSIMGSTIFLALPVYLKQINLNYFDIPGFISLLITPITTEEPARFSMASPVTDLDVGLVMGITLVTSILIRFWSGGWLDRYGRLIVLRFGLLLSLVTITGFFFVHSLSIYLYLLKAVQGISLGLIFGTTITYVIDIAPYNRRAELIAIFGLGGQFAHAVGPVIGEQLVIATQSLIPLVIIGSIFLVGSFVLVLFIPEPNIQKSVGAVKRGFFSVLFRKRNVSLIIVGFLFGIGMVSVFNFLMLYTRSLDMTTELFFLTYSGTAIVLRVFFRSLPEKVGLERILFPAMLFFGSCMFSLIFINSPYLLILSGFLGGLGHGFIFPALSALFANRQEKYNRGLISNAFTNVLDMGALLGSPLFGLLSGFFIYSTCYALIGSIVVSGAVVFVILEYGKLVKIHRIRHTRLNLEKVEALHIQSK
jgi:MFS family permease